MNQRHQPTRKLHEVSRYRFTALCLLFSLSLLLAQQQRALGSGFVVLGAKSSQTIGLREEQAGPGSVPWYSPAYSDVSWPAGQLDENNTVPSHRSKLWRVAVRVDTPPAGGAPIKLKLFGDDALRVYFDGYLLGSYGAPTGGWAGAVVIDVTDRMTAGMHVIGIRLDNGDGGSRMQFRMLDEALGSPESLKGVGGFWSNFYSMDAEERKRVCLAAVEAAKLKPDDIAVRRMAFLTYVKGPAGLRDIAAAQRDADDIIRRGLKFPSVDRYDLARATGQLEALLPQLTEAAKSDTQSAVKLADALREIKNPKEASRWYSEACSSAGKLTEFQRIFYRCQSISGCLDCGDVGTAVRLLAATSAEVKKAPNAALDVARLYRRLGDRATASEFRARYEQATNNAPGSSLESAEACLEEGVFDQCLAHLDSAEQATSSPGRTMVIGPLRVRALAELGRRDQAASAAAQIPWARGDAENEQFLYNYLLVARALNGRDQMKAGADRLRNLLKQKQAETKYYRPNPEHLVELAATYQLLGDVAAAKEYATDVTNQVLDVALPANQWQLGRALRILQQEGQAAQHLAKAQALDPKHYWIRKTASSAP
jgi:hypothetical protein